MLFHQRNINRTTAFNNIAVILVVALVVLTTSNALALLIIPMCWQAPAVLPPHPQGGDSTDLRGSPIGFVNTDDMEDQND